MVTRPPSRTERCIRLAAVVAPLTGLFVVVPLGPAVLATLDVPALANDPGLWSGVILLDAMVTGALHLRR
jgi:hypothetical protein